MPDVLFPVRAFVHLDDEFKPSVGVPADHPMVALRPDLFTDNPPQPKTAKE